MPESISFGTWLRQQRRSLDLTQKTLANQIGCAEITVRRMETDEYKPSSELANVLFEKLGIPESERTQWVHFARGLTEFPHYERKTNLPTSLTSFIGREKEQDEIIQLISKNRLVTLAGVGGIGKTRLAIQVRQGLLNDYPNGVWFISLDSLSNPALVIETAASIFGIREGSSEQPLLERLIYSLRSKTALLILDNCEHLLDACAQLITALLINCPNLKVLVTSREILNMEGEAIHYAATLSIPEQAERSIQKIKEHESIQLFAERAALVLSSFRLTTDNIQPAVNICHRLDGIPLAIEMAAARVDILQMDEILRQLDHCFNVLVGKSRTPLLRHQTMRASMDWSWGLLNEAEQVFMRQLSVFAGGWTLESAQTVCSGDVLSLTSALVRKSLIVVNQEPGPETRYRFHEVIRQYAREKLIESGEEEIIHTRHLKYFLDLSEKAEPALKGPAQIEWMARLNDERDNIRAALAWADKTDVEAGLYIASRLERLWESFDIREGNNWLSTFLQKPESHAYVQARANALYVYGSRLVNRQRFHEARVTERECLELYRALGDQQGEIDALLSLGDILFDAAKAKKFSEQALALAQSIGDLWRQANALAILGGSYSVDERERFIYWEQAIMLFRQLGDWRSLADLLSVLAISVMLDGDLESAKKRLAEAALLGYQLNDQFVKTKINTLYAYGRMAVIRGEYGQARVYYQEALEVTHKLGDDTGSHWFQTRLGYLALCEGKITESYDIFVETTQNFQKDQMIIGVIFSLEGMAGLFIRVDKHHVAARLIGWADEMRKRIGDRRPPVEQADVDKIIAACLAKLGEAAFSDAYEEGKKMTMDEAVALALNE